MIEEFLKKSILKKDALKIERQLIRSINPNINPVQIALQGFFTQPSPSPINKGSLEFQWLYYKSGKIVHIPFDSKYDILSGPFQGCWMVVYEINGIKYVGHIGTATEESSDTNAVKKYWNTFVKLYPDAPIVGFQPYIKYSKNDLNYYSKKIFEKYPYGDWVDCTFGLVTKEKFCFSIFSLWETKTGNVLILGVERAEKIKHKRELCTIFDH